MVKVGMGVDYKLWGQLVVTQVMSQTLFFVFSETAGIYNNAIAGSIVNYVTACSQCIKKKTSYIPCSVIFVFLPAWGRIDRIRNLRFCIHPLLYV